MGSTSLEKSEGENLENSRNWFWTGLTRSTSQVHRQNYALPALDEDGPAPASFEPFAANERISEENERSIAEMDRAAKSSEFDAQNPPAQGLTRARSTTQMRDLRDQMQDLKGKISSLKRRARDDSMRRRSLQSLRTPSPFTAAEQWYDNASSSYAYVAANTPSPTPNMTKNSCGPRAEGNVIVGKGEVAASNNPEPRLSPEKVDSHTESDFDLTPRNNSAMQVERPPKDTPGDEPTSHSDLTQEPGPPQQQKYSNVDQLPDSGIALPEGEEDSLYGDHDYHETSSSPTVGERHEDRPDAFDYEHFFLHSGIGTLARKDLSRSSSCSSIYSVETTKPSHTSHAHSNSATTISLASEDSEKESADATPKRPPPPRQNGGHQHSRNGSVESSSTVATWATATEGATALMVERGKC